MGRLGKVDLKLRLSLHVVAVASLCFLAASAYVVFASHRSGQAKAEHIAEIVAKYFELQQEKLHWVMQSSDSFPDLETIAMPLMAPGLCIGYWPKTGDPLQRLCSGLELTQTEAPDLFGAVYRNLFEDVAVFREVVFHGTIQGTAVVTLDQAFLIGESWRETRQLLSVMGVSLIALCTLTYALLERALRPTKIILAALKQLDSGDLSTRLPRFDLAELSAIRNGFNTLAEDLQISLAERGRLTGRLFEVQDQERLHLARELHDEFGQCLAAIRAVVASARQTAKAECPALLPECDSIARIAGHMMETVRAALARLRPPDVEKLGLTASLEGLIAGWNSRTRGRPQFTIEVCGSFDSLPHAFGESLYRIAQEAITNAVKHANATQVTLQLRNSEEPFNQEIELIVDDNGQACDIDLALQSGMGLIGMRERINLLSGNLSFEKQHPTGLILRALFPAPEKETHAMTTL